MYCLEYIIAFQPKLGDTQYIFLYEQKQPISPSSADFLWSWSCTFL